MAKLAVYSASIVCSHTCCTASSSMDNSTCNSKTSQGLSVMAIQQVLHIMSLGQSQLLQPLMQSMHVTVLSIFSADVTLLWLQLFDPPQPGHAS